MQPIRFRLILAALGLALAAPVTAQETAAPAEQTSPAAPADQTAPAAPADQTAPAAPTDQTAPAAPAPSAAAPAPEAPAPAPEAPQGTAPAEGTAPAAGTAPASEPAANGAAAPGANGAGNPAKPEVMEIVRDTFGDWQVRCAPDGKECFMYQLALDQEKNPVAEVSILKLPEQAEAAAGVTVVTPLGTLLPSGVVVQIDAGEKRQYPFAWCSQVGCFSRFGLAKPSLDSMKRGKAGKITLVSVGKPQSPVTLDLSLSGFTDAFNSLEVPAAPTAGTPAPAPAPALPPAKN